MHPFETDRPATLRPLVASLVLLLAGCSGQNGASSNSNSSPQTTSAVAPQTSPTPFDSRQVAANTKCFTSMADASELHDLVTQIVHEPSVETGCVTAGGWALVGYRTGRFPLATLFAMKNGTGHWVHVAHGPKVISAAQMIQVAPIYNAPIDPKIAKLLETMERKIPRG